MKPNGTKANAKYIFELKNALRKRTYLLNVDKDETWFLFSNCCGPSPQQPLQLKSVVSIV